MEKNYQVVFAVLYDGTRVFLQLCFRMVCGWFATGKLGDLVAICACCFVRVRIYQMDKGVTTMATSYNAQINNAHGKYTLQFETNNYEYFKEVEKACQRVIDKRDKARDKERASRMRTMGHL